MVWFWHLLMSSSTKHLTIKQFCRRENLIKMCIACYGQISVMSFQTTRPWFCSQGSLECWCIFICSIHSLMILNPKQFGVFVQRMSRQCSDGSWASDLLRWVHQAYQSHDSLYWIIQLWSSLVGEFISLSKCYLTDNCITVDLFVRDILFTLGN